MTRPTEAPRPAGVSPKRTNARALAGRRFGRLKVMAETTRRTGAGHIVWRCRCTCGEIADVIGANLTSGNTSSCGCLQVERSRKPNAARKG